MAGGLFSLAKLFGVTIRESATDGSDFTNPDADYRRLFLGEDGQLHVKDAAGTVTDIGSAPGEILDIPTAETNATLVLAPDGSGGVEFRAESSSAALGKMPFATMLGSALTDTYTTAQAIAANGGAFLFPISLPAAMDLQACRVYNTDTTTARSWEWRLFTDPGSTTLAEVSGAHGSESFTAAAASKRTAAASSAPVALQAGLYWLVIRNTHATSSFGLGYVLIPASGHVVSAAQATTGTVSALGSTFDASVSMSSPARVYGVALLGRVFGESTSTRNDG